MYAPALLLVQPLSVVTFGGGGCYFRGVVSFGEPKSFTKKAGMSFFPE